LTVSTITTTPLPTESPWAPFKLSVEQYEAMIESGIFTERDKLQLIDSGPQHDGYAKLDVYRSGQHVPVVLDGTIVGQVAVDDLLHWCPTWRRRERRSQSQKAAIEVQSSFVFRRTVYIE
jgi:hypothetical protein